jgi:hypothetical protein
LARKRRLGSIPSPAIPQRGGMYWLVPATSKFVWLRQVLRLAHQSRLLRRRKPSPYAADPRTPEQYRRYVNDDYVDLRD